jgi:L-alanine-DL-glutamate epimerase-like enolase superfamily enzyme
VKLHCDYVQARLRAPFVAAWGSIRDRPLVLVRLEDSDGHVGIGEAAPLAGYHGVNVEDVREALEACRDILAARIKGSPNQVLSEWRRMAATPAVAAVDLALWDLEGRRAGQPVWRLIQSRSMPRSPRTIGPARPPRPRPPARPGFAA